MASPSLIEFFAFTPANMSPARAKWNKYVGNTPGLEERSSDKDKRTSPLGSASAIPHASTSQVNATIRRSSTVKNAPPGVTAREGPSTDTTTQRARSDKATTTTLPPEMVTRTVIVYSTPGTTLFTF